MFKEFKKCFKWIVRTIGIRLWYAFAWCVSVLERVFPN